MSSPRNHQEVDFIRACKGVLASVSDNLTGKTSQTPSHRKGCMVGKLVETKNYVQKKKRFSL